MREDEKWVSEYESEHLSPNKLGFYPVAAGLDQKCKNYLAIRRFQTEESLMVIKNANEHMLRFEPQVPGNWGTPILTRLRSILTLWIYHTFENFNMPMW